MTTASQGAAGELRFIALSAIDVADGFNPRRSFDERDLDALARHRPGRR